MIIKVSNDKALDKDTKLLVLNCFTDEISSIYDDLKNTLTESERDILKDSIDRKALTGKDDNIVFIPSAKNKSLLLMGCGSFDEFSVSKIKSLGSNTVLNAQKLGFSKCAIKIRHLDKISYDKSSFFTVSKENMQDPNKAFALLALGLHNGHYSFSMKGLKEKGLKEEDDTATLNKVFILGDKKIESFVTEGDILGKSINLSRSLINKPGNYCTPSFLAKEAEKLKGNNLTVDVLNKKDIEKLGMGSFMAVAKGSSEEPKFIVMHYRPKTKKGTDKIALVGKGITFDTGGISLKPASDMHLMKADMSGAATVIASMNAISKMGLDTEVVGIVPSCENMPGASAVKPGDIATAMNGKTIEILNTDAEGRLILADALAFANKKEKATHIIDIATLTGACMVALGDITTGLMTNDYEFAQDFMKSCRDNGEKVWPLPLFEEYKEQIKSDIADLANIGGRYGGAITAAIFLENFVDDTPWIHLDIAGTSWSSKGGSYYKKGATGIIVSSIVDFVKSR